MKFKIIVPVLLLLLIIACSSQESDQDVNDPIDIAEKVAVYHFSGTKENFQKAIDYYFPEHREMLKTFFANKNDGDVENSIITDVNVYSTEINNQDATIVLILKKANGREGKVTVVLTKRSGKWYVVSTETERIK